MSIEFGWSYVCDPGQAVQAINSVATAAQNMRGAVNSSASAVQAFGWQANQTVEHVNELQNSFGGLAAKMLVVSEVRNLLKGWSEAFQEASENAAKLAEQNLVIRDTLRELKNLRGDGTTSDEVLGQTVQFRMRTATKRSEAEEIQAEFEGAVAASRDRWEATHDKAGKPLPGVREQGIAPGVEEGLKEQAAILAVRTGLDMQTAGRMAGLIGEYKKVGSVEEGAATLGQIEQNLNVRGVGKVKTLAKSFLNMVGEMVDEDEGRFNSLENGSAVYAVATRRFGSGARSATGIKQANRLLRKAAFSEDEEVKALGITAQDDFVTALRKLTPTLTGRDADQWLQEHKIGRNATERASAIRLAKMLGEIDVAMGDPEVKKAARATVATNQRFLKEDPAAAKRIADATRDAAKVVRGRPMEALEILRTQAEADLIAQQRIDTPKTNFADSSYNPLNWGAIQDPRKARIDAEVRRRLVQLAPDLAKRYPSLTNEGLIGQETTRFRQGEMIPKVEHLAHDEELGRIVNEVAPELKARGIDLNQQLGGIPEAVEDLRHGAVNPVAVPARPRAVVGAMAGGVAGLGGPAGALPGGNPGPQAALDASDLKQAAGALQQAAGALLTAAVAHRDTYPGYDGDGGFTPLRLG